MTSDRAEQAVNAWNAEYLDALYERWQADPEDVDPQWREFFKGFDLGVRRMQPAEAPGGPAPGAADLARQGHVDRLIYQYRDIGHFAADLDPLGTERPLPAALRGTGAHLADQAFQRADAHRSPGARHRFFRHHQLPERRAHANRRR